MITDSSFLVFILLYEINHSQNKTCKLQLLRFCENTFDKCLPNCKFPKLILKYMTMNVDVYYGKQFSLRHTKQRVRGKSCIFDDQLVQFYEP